MSILRWFFLTLPAQSDPLTIDRSYIVQASGQACTGHSIAELHDCLSVVRCSADIDPIPPSTLVKVGNLLPLDIVDIDFQRRHRAARVVALVIRERWLCST